MEAAEPWKPLVRVSRGAMIKEAEEADGGWCAPLTQMARW
jgi:hypothetical protein